MRHLFKNRNVLLLVLLFLLFNWGCKKDIAPVRSGPPPAQFPITLAEAKDWFSNRPVVNSFSQGDEKIIIPVQPAWEKALIGYAQSGREILTVPLQRDSLLKKQHGNQANVVMLLSKDSLNVIEGQLLMYHADAAYYAGHANNLSITDFTGEFLFFDLDYNYQYGFITRNGVPVEQIDTVTVTARTEGEAESRADPTVDCIPYTQLSLYCWTAEPPPVCCPLNIENCVLWVSTYYDCQTIGGGGGPGGWSGGGGSGGGTGGSGGSNPPPTFTDILTNNIPVGVFIANGGTLPPGFTETLAQQLQQFYQEIGLTQKEYYHLLANPNLIPILLNFCTTFPPPPNTGTIEGTLQGGNNPYGSNDETQLCKYLRDIVFTCELDALQGKWLANNVQEIFRIHEFLGKHGSDAASIKAMQWYVKANTNGVFPNFTADDHIIEPAMIAEFVINVAVYKQECQNQNGGQPCSDWDVYSTAAWRTLSGYIHTGLDVCGMIPAGGEPCDFVNGVIYTVEGDLMNASMSFSATLPIAGWFVTGAKYAGLAVIFKEVQHILQFNIVGNLIDFGDRGVLRAVLNITDFNHEAHHIVPWALRNNDLVQHAAKGRYHMNHFDNGVELEKFRIATSSGTHGNHPTYNGKVEAKMNELWNNLRNYYGSASAVPVEVARTKLIELQNSIKNHIVQNPTIKINDLTLNGVNVPSVP
jgi:hypothetical protein